ncbi:TPA: Uma2 family endonuclease [bacterium]|nr:Uma2 family endonuclease [bacterium]
MRTAFPDIVTSNNKTMPEGKVSYEEFLDWLDEDTLAEWVDGEIIIKPLPSIRHQNLAKFLLMLINQYVELNELGEVIIAPFQMKLITGRELDIIFVSKEHLGRIKDTFIDGPADMVVEIVSPESMVRDRGEKYFEYESGGVPEYWLIDPIREQAEFYRLGEDKHYHTILPNEDGIYHSEIIKGFWINVSWLWKEPLPKISDICREFDILR